MEKFRAFSIGGLDPGASDEQVKEAILANLKDFKFVSVKVLQFPEEARTACAVFRYVEDAEEAYDLHRNMELFGYHVDVSPIPLDHPLMDVLPQGMPARSSRNAERDRQPREQEFRSDHFHSDNVKSINLSGKRPNPDKNQFRPPGRTLFVGHIATETTGTQLKRIFKRYGTVEDVDRKFNYAFVRFFSLDMAMRAKNAMHGKPINGLNCTVGYGTSSSTNYLFVSGIGSWTNEEELIERFSRFGKIEARHWPPGKNYAYLQYTDIGDAVEAHLKMQGFPLGGKTRRLCIDFSDRYHMDSPVNFEPDNFNEGPDYSEIADINFAEYNYYEGEEEEAESGHLAFNSDRSALSPRRDASHGRSRIDERSLNWNENPHPRGRQRGRIGRQRGRIGRIRPSNRGRGNFGRNQRGGFDDEHYGREVPRHNNRRDDRKSYDIDDQRGEDEQNYHGNDHKSPKQKGFRNRGKSNRSTSFKRDRSRSFERDHSRSFERDRSRSFERDRSKSFERGDNKRRRRSSRSSHRNRERDSAKSSQKSLDRVDHRSVGQDSKRSLEKYSDVKTQDSNAVVMNSQQTIPTDLFAQSSSQPGYTPNMLPSGTAFPPPVIQTQMSAFPQTQMSAFPQQSTVPMYQPAMMFPPPVLNYYPSVSQQLPNFSVPPPSVVTSFPTLNLDPKPGPKTVNTDFGKGAQDITTRFPVVWSGALVLKNSAFVTNMYLVSGSVLLVDALLRDQRVECPVLKIMQRLRLDQPDKVNEIDRRVSSSGRNGCSVLLAVPASAEVGDVNNVIQQRPLSSLGSYLREKAVAAVIPLPPGCEPSSQTGVLHAFPPCEFASEFLKKEAPELAAEYPKDDHLLVIIMREN